MAGNPGGKEFMYARERATGATDGIVPIPQCGFRPTPQCRRSFSYFPADDLSRCSRVEYGL